MSPRRRWLRRILFLLAGTGVLLLSAVIGGVYWLNTEPGNNWVRMQLIKQATPYLPEATLDLERLRISLAGELEVTGISLRRWDGQPLVTIETLHLKLDPGQLLGEEINLGVLTIEQPYARAEVQDDGTVDWIRALGLNSDKEPPPPQAWAGLEPRVGLEDVRIVSGQFDLVNDGETFTVDNIGLGTVLKVGGGPLASLESFHLDLVPGPYAPIGLTGDIRYQDGAVLLPALDLDFGDSAAAITGAIHQVEVEPTADLELALLPIAAGLAEPWTDEQIPSQDINLTARIAGPLSALTLDGALTTLSEQTARLTAEADLTTDRLTWAASLSTEALDLEPLVPAITEPVRLAGRYDVSGQGTEWPAGIEAHIVADNPAQVLWGQRVEGLQITADLSGGKLRFSEGEVQHAVGLLRILSGEIDLVRSEAELVLDATVPSLQSLSTFGVSGYRGSVKANGPVTVNYGADPLTVDATLGVIGQQVSSSTFRLSEIRSGALTINVVGQSVDFSGGASLSGLEASGVIIDGITVSELIGSVKPNGEVTSSSVIELTQLQVGDGTFVLDGLKGAVVAGVDATGLPVLNTALQLGGMTIEPIQYSLDGGPVGLELEENVLYADLSLSRNDRVVINTRTRGDLGSGDWRVDELLLFPADDRGIAVPMEEPFTFTLVEDGVDEVQLVLVLASESPDVSNPRLLEREGASFITLSGGTSGEEPDVRLTAQNLELDWVTDMINVFYGSPEAPALDDMTGQLDLTISVEGISSNARLSGDVSMTSFSYPGITEQVFLDLDVGGQLGHPEATLSIHDARGLLLAGRASVPLDLEAAKFVCEEPIAFRAMLAPVTMTRLSRRLPVLGTLPEGDLSADIHLTGPTCDPDLAFTAALETPVGVNGEYARVDMTVVRGIQGLDLVASVEEGGIRRLQMDAQAPDSLKDVLRWAVEGGEAPNLSDPATYISSLNMRAKPSALPMSLLKRLTGFHTQVEGNIGGELLVTGPSDALVLNSELHFLPNEPIQQGFRPTVGGLGDLVLYELGLTVEPSVDFEHGYELNLNTEMSEVYLREGETGKRMDFHGRIPWTIAMLRDEELESLYQTPGWLLGFVGEGWLPMASLNGVVDGVSDASGDLRLQGTLSGPLSNLQPTLPVSVTLEDGALSYAPLSVRYESIYLDMNVLADRLTLRPSSMTARPLYAFLGTRDPGTLSVTGTIGLDQLQPSTLDMTAELRDFWLSGTEDTRLAISTEDAAPLRVTNTYPAVNVRGGIRLTEGSIVLAESFWTAGGGLALDERIHIIRRGEDGPLERTLREEEPVSELMQNLDLQVNLDLSKQLKLDVEMPLSQDYGQQLAALSSLYASAQMTGQLQAGYLNNNLSLAGAVEFLQGELSWLGRDFTMDDGSVVKFTGREYSNPYLILQARYITSSYGDVVMGVEGPAFEPNLSFSSENAAQEYDQTDLFAILLTGKPASAMADSEGESNSALMSAAIAQVSGSVGSALSGTLVDEVDWDPSSGVRVGKAINDRLFLTYDWNTNAEENENRNQITLEWLITRRAFAEFLTGDATESSAQIYWRVLFGDTAGSSDTQPDAETE